MPEVGREPLFTDRRADTGPFDIMGDVHGCLNELTRLLERLGYVLSLGTWRHLRRPPSHFPWRPGGSRAR